MNGRMKVIVLTALFCALLPLRALGTGMPEWTYPLSPEILEDRQDYLRLTNRSSLLPSDYEPTDLVTITARHISAINGQQLRKAAHEALLMMFEAAEADGCILYLKSCYRSYSTQKTMYGNRMNKVGYDDGVVAYPGSSDHQTGLGMDILNLEWTKKSGMTPAFAQTKEAAWMAEHCAEYGFVIRYEEDKQDLTGIIFEPWHLRYVGPEAARYMTDRHLCLEEFDEEWHRYIRDWEAAGGDFKKLLRERSAPDPAVVLYTTDDGEDEISLFSDP